MVHAFSVLFVILAFYLMVKGNRKAKPLFWLFSSLSYVASVSIRFSNILLILPFVWFAWETLLPAMRKSYYIKSCLFTSLSVLIGLLVVINLQWEHVLAKSKYDEWLGLFSPIIGVGIQTILNNIGFGGFILFIAGVCLVGVSEYKNVGGVFILWFLITFFFYANLSTYDERFFCELLPSLVILLAFAIQKLYRFSRAGTAIIVFLLLLNMVFVAFPIIKDRHIYSGEKEYALWVKRITPADAVILAMDDFVFIQFYSERKTIEHPVNPSFAEAEKWVEELFAKYGKAAVPLYAIESAFSYDANGAIARALRKRFYFKEAGSFLCEDYHKATLSRNLYRAKLIQLIAKEQY